MTIDSRLESAGLPDHEPDVDEAWTIVAHQGRRKKATRHRALVAAVLAVVALAAGSLVLRPNSDQLDVASDAQKDDDGTGTWTPIPEAPLSARQPGVAVWTGTEMVIVGGDAANPCGLNADCLVEPVPLQDGAAYDPEAESWRAIENAPVAFTVGRGVWTGSEVLVLATTPLTGQPATLLSYDPKSDAWSDRAKPPDGDLGEPAWTGERWVFPSRETNDGSGGWSYLPTEDRWEQLEPDTIGPASERSIVAAGGSLYLFASVYDQPAAPTNGFYEVAQFDLESRKWVTLEVPEIANNGSTWISTGDYVVNPTPSATNAQSGREPIPYGAVLDVQSGEMRALPQPPRLADPAEGPRTGYFGDAAGWVVADTRLFDPASDTWLEIPSRPGGVYPGATVWTGNALITWGGFTESNRTLLSAAGHRYQPPPLPGDSEPDTAEPEEVERTTTTTAEAVPVSREEPCDSITVEPGTFPVESGTSEDPSPFKESVAVAHGADNVTTVELHSPGIVVIDLVGERVEDVALSRGIAQMWLTDEFVQVRWFTGGRDRCDSFTVTATGGTESSQRKAAVELADRVRWTTDEIVEPSELRLVVDQVTLEALPAHGTCEANGGEAGRQSLDIVDAEPFDSSADALAAFVSGPATYAGDSGLEVWLRRAPRMGYVEGRLPGVPDMRFYLVRGRFDPVLDPNTWAVVIEIHQDDDGWRAIRYRASMC